MTSDELSADMEGRIVERLQADLIGQRALGLGDRAVRDDDIRALLIAYQEQRRALERIEQGLPEIRAVHRFTETRLIARAALNQKGDER